MTSSLLALSDLQVTFSTRRGLVEAVRGVTLSLGEGEMLGLVGESGSGKSVTGFAITRLLDAAGRITAGHIRFRGQDITRVSSADLRNLHGAAMAMIFQNPRAALNPIRAVGDEALADDLFQDTFLRFLKSASQEREMTNVPAYLLRIARNLCLNAKRDHKTTVALEDFHFQFEDRSAEHAELARLVAMALDLLPDDHKEALSLQTYGGLSYKEIADIMGVPMTTVRNWIVRAKKKMREILSPYLADVPVRSQKMRGSI